MDGSAFVRRLFLFFLRKGEHAQTVIPRVIMVGLAMASSCDERQREHD